MIVKAFSSKYGVIDKKDKFIFINGCFDIFHLGHLRMINYAKETFPYHGLIIGMNSDESIKQMNKKHPLIFDELYRSNLLEELCDIVIIYDDFYDYLKIIEDFKPEFIIKGTEYKDKDIPEKKLDYTNIIYFNGGKFSSTNIYNDIIEKFKDATEI